MFQALACRHAANPGGRAQRAVANDVLAQLLELGRVDRFVHQPRPVARSGHRPIRERGKRSAIGALRKARPGPLLGAANQAGAHRVGFDISAERQKIGILLDAEMLVTSLIEMAAHLAVVSVMAADVGEGDPLHELLELPRAARTEDQMPVIRHEAPSQEVDLVAAQAFT